MIQKNLIFDLGFHNGDDTDFYLKKGFNVVAVEANPKLVKEGVRRFRSHITKKKLVLINKAVSNATGRQSFYINLNRYDWGSCEKNMAESDGSRAKAISIETVSLGDLCINFGTPLYLKVDIEGYDPIVAKQLCSLKNKPRYVSFEISKKDYARIFSYLRRSGYVKFQLVNQLNNLDRRKDVIRKTHEGKDIDYQFSKYSSGFFGKDLPKEKWFSFDDALARYLKFRELKMLDNQELALGWLDLHASL